MSQTKLKAHIPSPFGLLHAKLEDEQLVELKFVEDEGPRDDDTHAIFKLLRKELGAYFKGDLKKFSVPLNPKGTTFQKRVWAKLRRVSFGARITYLELAEIYGDKKAIRAVAAANGANPIAIIVPCHRIIGHGGKLTGYAWGIDRKKKLLQHEMSYTPQHDLFG